MQNSTLICDGCVKNEVGDEFSLWQGISDEHRAAILEAAKSDELIVSNTGDAQRFASLEKFNQWLTTNPIPYTLTPKDSPNVLSGFIWFVQMDLPEEIASQTDQQTNWTFAVRLYENARGKRLSYPFMDQAFKEFWQENPDEIIWLSTGKDNAIAKKIYEKFGFQKIADTEDRSYYLLSPVQ